MDRTLYNAAMKGNTKSLAEYLKRDEEIGYQVTPKENTVLHVAALHGHSDFVGEVLKITPALLCRQNKRNETALHMAANEGHTEVVRVLLRIAGEENYKETLMRMTNENGDTALHKAVRSEHIDVVKIVLEKEYEYPTNKAGETPLYLAAESGFIDILHEILESCKNPNYGAGPFGRTPLHAAVVHEHSKCVESLWQRNKSLCEEPDKWGWNSLHYAVKLGLKEVVSDMLEWKNSLAYLPAGSKNDWTTTIHIAASEGDVNMINELLKHCPDCWEMLNSRGQNFLHVAILNRQKRLVRSFLVGKLERLEEKLEGWHIILADEKDNDGNTPLHLLAASDGSLVPISLFEHPSAKKMSFNKENQTPLDVAFLRTGTTNTVNYRHFKRWLGNGRRGLRDFDIKYTKMQKEQRENRYNENLKDRLQDFMNNLTQVRLVVATLLVTVTFAAGFTLPGGFDSDPGPNKGMAILIRKIAFRAFIVSDAIAFACSAGAVYCYFFTSAYAFTRQLKHIGRLHMIASILLLVAIPAVVIAFVTGMYSTLAHSHGLAVTVCAIGCIFLLLKVLIYRTLA